MRPEARHCDSCGAVLAQRVVEGVPREVCPACHRISYRNPLPIASALVLNDRREVLLVQRRDEPHAGMWCLPIGFAEMRETIAEAARRELREEAGIDGRVVRLLDVDSHISETYGDLLIVTFEIEKTGGEERAGDDAVDWAYAALDRLPPLAFAANERAIEACRRAHAEEWAVRDAFAELRDEAGAGHLSAALSALLHARAETMAARWAAEVQAHATTPAYAVLPPAELAAEGRDLLALFGRWWADDLGEREARGRFLALGRRRRSQGVALPELLSALMLLRRIVWTCAVEEEAWRRPLDVPLALELDRRLVLFFDRALFHAARGHLHAGLDRGPDSEYDASPAVSP